MADTPVHADWKKIDRTLRRLGRVRAAHDYEEGRWLLAARRTRVHVHLGLGSFAEYVDRILGYDARATIERLRVAEALEALPALSEALASSRIVWSAAREISRVATAETEAAWLAGTSGRTVREIETMVAGRRPGDLPTTPADPALVKRIIRLELRPEAVALFREAVARLRREVDASMTEEDAVVEMARRVLGPAGNADQAPFQVALTVCERCDRAFQSGHGDEIEVGPEVAEQAGCDAQVIGRVDGKDVTGGVRRATQTIPPAVRRAVVRRDHGQCVVPGCRNAIWVEVHHITPRSEGGGHDPDGLVLLCGAHHRMLHRGYLWIEGTVSSGLSFRHADGSLYGELPPASVVESAARAFAALRARGIGETAARLLVARAGLGSTSGGVPVKARRRAALGRPLVLREPVVAYSAATHVGRLARL